VLYGVTQWNEAVRGLSETEAGLLLLPMTLISSLVISAVPRRNLVRGPVIVAALTCGGGPGYQTAAFALTTGTRAAVVIARSSSKPDPVRQAIRWLTQ
jgi:hypothetical protein